MSTKDVKKISLGILTAVLLVKNFRGKITVKVSFVGEFFTLYSCSLNTCLQSINQSIFVVKSSCIYLL